MEEPWALSLFGPSTPFLTALTFIVIPVAQILQAGSRHPQQPLIGGIIGQCCGFAAGWAFEGHLALGVVVDVAHDTRDGIQPSLEILKFIDIDSKTLSAQPIFPDARRCDSVR